MVTSWNLSVVQSNIRPVFRRGSASRPWAIQDNLDRAADLVLSAVPRTGSRVFLFPGFFLQGDAPERPVEEWLDAAISLYGPEVGQLGEIASQADAWIAGMIVERHADWPGRYFHTVVIVGPDGRVGLAYRAMHGLGAQTRPIDILDEYIARYGFNSLYPVLDTPIGRLGALAGSDINFPEAARSLVLNGAEIILHCTFEGKGVEFLPGGGWELARRVRAYENICYIASANAGRILDGDLPEGWSHGGSEIVDFSGRLVTTAGEGADETIVTGEIGIEDLRRRRGSPNVNFIAQLQPHVHLPAYEANEHWPANAFASQPIRSAADVTHLGEETIARLQASGRLTPPPADA